MDNIATVWEEYSNTKDPDLRQDLILHYVTIVNHVAGRLMIHVGGHVEYDDLVGYGVFGLIDAVEKFDPKKGVKFETYATIRIRGAIIDHMRQMDWVPRTARQKNKLLDAAYTKLEATHGREPTMAELAVELGLSVDEAQELVNRAGVFSLVSLDEHLDGDTDTTFAAMLTDRAPTPLEQAERREKMQVLSQTIDDLPEREKFVIALFYFEGLTITEISSIMGVSKSRVSQIHKKALRRLQVVLGSYSDLLYGTS